MEPIECSHAGLSLHAVCRKTSAQWQGLLKQHVPATKQMSLKHDESAVHEELNLAWAGEWLHRQVCLCVQ